MKALLCLFVLIASPLLATEPTTSFHKDHRQGLAKIKHVTAVSGKVAGLSGNDLAQHYLQNNADLFGLNSSLANLELRSVERSLRGSHYRYQQKLANYDVLGAEVIVSISYDEQVFRVFNNSFPASHFKRGARVGLNFEEAYDTAWYNLRVHGPLMNFPKAQLTWIPEGSSFRLVYQVDLSIEAPFGHWRHTIDAESGEVHGVERTSISRQPMSDMDFESYTGPVLDRLEAIANYEGRVADQGHQIRAKAAATATALVFDPDPVTALQNSSLSDTSPASSFSGAYVSRSLQDVDLTGGVYSLNGPWVNIINFESPNTAPSTTTNGNWTANRGNNAFNDVMTYFHIDQSQRYMQSMGFTGSTGIQFGSIGVDSDGINGSDQSYFLPGSNRMSFGHGCVDDNEDAFVILHEYGHAIQHSINNNWSGGDTGAMGEGFGDYWGGSYRHSTANGTFQINWAFPWDGHNSCWGGRDLGQTQFQYDPSATYPAHAQVGGVDGDELWSAPLFAAMLELKSQGVARAEIDQIILEAHFGLGSGMSMRDMAGEIVATANTLQPSGPHAGVFQQKFEDQNILAGGTIPGGDTEVFDGTSLANQSAAKDVQTNYFIQVPAGASNLVVTTSGGTGDVDLYLKFGSKPTTGSYDCRGYNSGNSENCTTASLSAGTYYIMTNAYSAFSGVTLTVDYDLAGNTPPSASFTQSITNLSVSFSDTSSDSDGTVTGWSWNFGDGSTSSSQNPSHTYSSAGTYTVTLTATDNGGATDSASTSLTVTAANQAPTAAFSQSISDLTVSFSDGSSDSDGSISSRSWNFGDGNTSSSTNPTHTYAAAGTYTVSLTVTDNGGLSDTASTSVVVSTGPVTGELVNGDSVPGLGENAGQYVYFYIDIPSGASDFNVNLTGGSGDADLYVREGTQPTTGTYDCRSWASGNTESCSFASPTGGRYHIGLYAYSTFSGATLSVNYTAPGTCDGNNNQTNLADTSGWLDFEIVVPQCATQLNIVMSGGTGDADLYTRFGANPTTSTYDCRPYATGNNENCSVTNPAAGTWYVRLRAYQAYSGVNLTISYE